jgi:hypothetical protein
MQPLRNAVSTLLPGSCGFGIIYNHGVVSNHYVVSDIPGGTGICVAAFVDEHRCKRVYDWITENCEILYQSPVVRNQNSGRPNFLVVFKRK